jgi:DNA-binding response OmpR family regulator
LVTGYVSEMRLRDGEAEECLAKPFSTEVLLRRVRQLLEPRRFLMETEDPLKRACGSA